MKVCIAYYSRFGNGKKCAEYVEETLKQVVRVGDYLSL